MPPRCLIIAGNSQQCPVFQPTFTSKKVQPPKPNINPIPVPYHYKEEVKKSPLGRCEKRHRHSRTNGAEPWLLPRKKWETNDSRLSASKFPMQMGNTLYQLAIQTVTAGTTKHKKWSWMPWIATTQSP